MDERLAEKMPHGAIRWAAESDKMGVLHLTPISPDARAEIEHYLSLNPRGLGDAPLFPSVERSDVPISRSLATKWLTKAESLAGLPKLLGGIYHPYRRLWATERQNLSDVLVAAGGGWKSTKTLKIYQQPDAAGVLAAVLNAS
jgi:integrase